MITKQLVRPEVSPPEAAVSAKCHNCMVEYFANVLDLKVKATLSPSGSGWFWITHCPKCSGRVVFSEIFAEELKDE